MFLSINTCPLQGKLPVSPPACAPIRNTQSRPPRVVRCCGYAQHRHYSQSGVLLCSLTSTSPTSPSPRILSVHSCHSEHLVCLYCFILSTPIWFCRSCDASARCTGAKADLRRCGDNTSMRCLYRPMLSNCVYGVNAVLYSLSSRR